MFTAIHTIPAPYPEIQIQTPDSSLRIRLSNNSSSWSPMLSVSEETIISNDLESLFVEASTSQKYSFEATNLINEMASASFLPLHIQETSRAIGQVFTEINSNDWMEQAGTIAMVLFRIIKPALKIANLQEQQILQRWEHLCKDIITSILPKEEKDHVDIFLKRSEILLQDDLLSRDIYEISTEVSQLFSKTIQSVAHKINQNATQLDIPKEGILRTITDSVNILGQDLEKCISEIVNEAIVNETIGSTIEEQKKNLNCIANECTVLLTWISTL